jgi:alpha/beta superfamily hydrolase
LAAPNVADVTDVIVESVRFPASTFALEGELAYPESEPPLGGAVIAGPHPLLGGTMHNNVVSRLAEGLARRGIATLRFNYRGIGRSEGPPVDVLRSLAEFWATSHIADEPAYRDDLLGALDFARANLGLSRMALIGYSFGCSLLPHAHLAPDVPLVVIAPTVGTHDYQTFVPLANPLLVIASQEDFATAKDRLETWYATLSGPKELIRGQFDNHFFRGHEERLSDTVFVFIHRQWSAACHRR